MDEAGRGLDAVEAAGTVLEHPADGRAVARDDGDVGDEEALELDCAEGGGAVAPDFDGARLGLVAGAGELDGARAGGDADDELLRDGVGRAGLRLGRADALSVDGDGDERGRGRERERAGVGAEAELLR